MLDRAVVADRLRAMRGNQTRESLAAELGVSPSSIGMYENGARMPRDEIKMKYAERFHTSIEALFFAPK